MSMVLPIKKEICKTQPRFYENSNRIWKIIIHLTFTPKTISVDQSGLNGVITVIIINAIVITEKLNVTYPFTPKTISISQLGVVITEIVTIIKTVTVIIINAIVIAEKSILTITSLTKKY